MPDWLSAGLTDGGKALSDPFDLFGLLTISDDKIAALARLALELNNNGVEHVFSQVDVTRDASGEYLAQAPDEYVIVVAHGTVPERSSEVRTGGVTLVQVLVGASSWGALSRVRQRVLSVAGYLFKYRSEGSSFTAYGASKSHTRIHVPVFYEFLST